MGEKWRFLTFQTERKLNIKLFKNYMVVFFVTSRRIELGTRGWHQIVEKKKSLPDLIYSLKFTRGQQSTNTSNRGENTIGGGVSQKFPY